MLNHDSELLNAIVVFDWLVPANGLPPKPSERTPDVPSAKSEFTRTVPAGSERYGSDALCEPCTPSDVSLRKIP
jgi:hypothetical protein